MPTGDDNKPLKAADFSDTPAIPASTLDLVRNVLRQQRDAVLWTVQPVGGGSLAKRLAESGSVDVQVHAVDSNTGRVPIVYAGTLTRRSDAAGDIALELCFDQPPTGYFRSYALCSLPLAIWPFTPVSLGGLPDTLAQPAVDARRGVAAMGPGALAAAGDVSEPITAANERLDVEWRDGELEIRLDVPPRRRGQPVVVETRTGNSSGEIQTRRDLVSLDTPLTEGKFAGYMTTRIHCSVPAHFALDRWRVTVRPLREDDLPSLSPNQVDAFLAGQRLTVLKTLAEGFPLRAAATWADQRAAIADPHATWLLRVATGKGGC